jgi:Mor family transcriptional regulator
LQGLVIWTPTTLLKMTGITKAQMQLDMMRIQALMEARDRAQNKEFKKLWSEKLKELLELINDRVH